MKITSRVGFAGACVVLATTVLYLVIIDSEGNNGPAAIAPWVAILTVSGSVAAVGAWLPSPRARSTIFAVTAAAMVAVGFLAIFSIGMLLLVGGTLLARAALSAAAEIRPPRGYEQRR